MKKQRDLLIILASVPWSTKETARLCTTGPRTGSDKEQTRHSARLHKKRATRTTPYFIPQSPKQEMRVRRRPIRLFEGYGVDNLWFAITSSTEHWLGVASYGTYIDSSLASDNSLLPYGGSMPRLRKAKKNSNRSRWGIMLMM